MVSTCIFVCLVPLRAAYCSFLHVYGGTLFVFPQGNSDLSALVKKRDIFAFLVSYWF